MTGNAPISPAEGFPHCLYSLHLRASATLTVHFLRVGTRCFNPLCALGVENRLLAVCLLVTNNIVMKATLRAVTNTTYLCAGRKAAVENNIRHITMGRRHTLLRRTSPPTTCRASAARAPKTSSWRSISLTLLSRRRGRSITLSCGGYT